MERIYLSDWKHSNKSNFLKLASLIPTLMLDSGSQRFMVVFILHPNAVYFINNNLSSAVTVAAGGLALNASLTWPYLSLNEFAIGLLILTM